MIIRGWLQGRNRKIFLRGQSHFSWLFLIFSWREMLFPGRKISILVDPEQILVCLKSEKQKKSPHFVTFPSFHFQFSTFLFTSFILFFSICPLFSLLSLCLFLPVGQQKFPSQKSWGGGGNLPLAPHLLCNWVAMPLSLRQTLGPNLFLYSL